LQTLGRAQLGLGQLEQAEAALQEARNTLRSERDDLRLSVQLNIDLGKLARARGQSTEAIAALHHGLELAASASVTDLEIEARTELQRQYRALGAFETALEHCSHRADALQRLDSQRNALNLDIANALRQIATLRTRWITDPFARDYSS
jgi:tetratricopeptide (TPR) repeat protein